MNRLLLVLIGLSICFQAFGQKEKEMSWKDYKNQAEEMIELRQYAKAAEAYENAFFEKPQRGDMLVKAAKNYELERDFTSAARVYEQIIDNPKYKSSKLDYAYALKQSNQYEKAMLEFASCLEMLNGNDSSKEIIINKEIMGCQFALEQIEGFVVKPYGIDIKPMTANINSAKPDFAPYQVSDTRFYYSTLEDGNATIKSSSWLEGDWADGVALKGFNGLKSKHLCNAVINADETEMYFTICNEDQVWGGLSSRCDIYMSKNKGKAWGQPNKLNDNVNYDGATNTQPFVLETNDATLIYFASNRPNGQGGMDLWLASKKTGEEEFGEAVNLGPNVNTAGNEITPFISQDENAIYFSSDGHITMGGFDIMKAVGSEFSWSQAENLGLPINSGADEKYYTIASNKTEGYFVSNRTVEGDVISSANEDIFSFNILPPHYFVEGIISDNNDMSVLEQAKVYLYELKEKSQDRRLLSVQDAKEGAYNYRLLPNRSYQLVAEAEGYVGNSAYLNTNDANLYVQERNLILGSEDLQEPVASINEVLPADIIVKEETDNLNSIEEVVTEAAIEETNVNLTEIVEAPTESANTNLTQAIAIDNEPTQTVEQNTFIETVEELNASIEATETVEEAPETYTSNTSINESTASENTYAANNSFVSKGETTFTTDASSNVVTSKSYSNTNNVSNFATSVPPIEVPLDKYEAKSESKVISTPNTNSLNFAETTKSAPEVIESVERIELGTSYKVQLIAVEFHNPEHRRYDGIKNLGLDLNTEMIDENGWIRVLLGGFKSKTEAESIMENARSNGFKRAFIVEYKDGKRNRRLR